jgi:hypothetical protein
MRSKVYDIVLKELQRNGPFIPFTSFERVANDVSGHFPQSEGDVISNVYKFILLHYGLTHEQLMSDSHKDNVRRKYVFISLCIHVLGDGHCRTEIMRKVEMHKSMYYHVKNEYKNNEFNFKFQKEYAEIKGYFEKLGSYGIRNK